jgi:tetratricopeptide (TPR) repeat protein
MVSLSSIKIEQNSAGYATGHPSRLAKSLFLALAAIALIYATFAGFRTVWDPDLGWQMATGRWVAQRHHIPSNDVFSYTASGQPWIYPLGSELIFYAVYRTGGFALLSWLGAVACAGTVALLLRRGTALAAGIAILAIPLIADRTTPRAEMFTIVLFAAYLSILWQNYRSSDARLWLLPVLMVAWVNLHLGFIAGLTLIAGFIGLDVLELLSQPPRRSDALRRLRHALPWYAVTAAATMLNPWGWRLYQAIARQNNAMEQHSHFISEWASSGWNFNGPFPRFSELPLQHTLTVIMFVALLGAAVGLFTRRLGVSILLLGAMYESMRHFRMQGLTACMVVVLAAGVLSPAWLPWGELIPRPRLRTAVAVTAAVLFAALAAWRIFEYQSNRVYLASSSRAEFGAGLAAWFPEAAAEFMLREDLPRNIFNSYNDGGFLVWSIGRKYPDYIDGRAIPFGQAALPRELQLRESPLDSKNWQQEADFRNINTLILPIDGKEIAFEQLEDFCTARNWAPVYFDEMAIVLVRRTPANAEVVNRLQVNCATATLPAHKLPHNAWAYEHWLNAAYELAVLRRDREALAASDSAMAIYPYNARLRRIRGNILFALSRRAEAEQEWLAALGLNDGDSSVNAAVWAKLAEMYEQQGRASDAVHAWQETVQLTPEAEIASQPILKALRAHALLRLARLFVLAGQPRPALQALDEAVHSAPSAMMEATTGRSFQFDIAQGRSAAWRSAGDLQQATSFAEQAVQLDPQASDAWSHLAKLYEREGRIDDQHRAEERAQVLAAQKP